VTKMDVLKGTLELLSDPARWTKDYLARDKDGEPAVANGPGAVCWCIVGGVSKVAFPAPEDELSDDRCEAYGEAMFEIRKTIQEKGLGGSIPDFNDEHPHAEVVAVLKETVERVEKETVPSGA
jgi:hypothetical protein